MSEVASPLADAAKVQVPKGTAFYGRKVNKGNYESEEASVFVQFDISDAEGATLENASNAFANAKSLVFEQLGIGYHWDADAKVVTEDGPAVIERSAVATTEAAFKPQPPGAPAGTTTERTGNPVDPEAPKCPHCAGEMYDNRATKKNPRQPDFRCKNYKSGCEGVVWPPRG